ncbi:peptidoglycan bridge formation glycyltransferase FemA/FemB family protein [Patescibacteria group bacterium]|nr:peptidoglycan bridge formation glycyltransferase FemA/FemB family protein [Patescibacteria group bacterium]
MKHITQSDAWARFRLSTPNVKKVLEIAGTKVYFHRIPHLPFTVAYIPRADVKVDDHLKNLCRKEGAIYLKVEPLTGPGGDGKPILPQHTIYIDLTKSEEDLLKNMHEKTRYNIRLAAKKGVVVKQSDDLETFMKILEKTEARQGFYSHYPDYYRKLWQIIKPIILIAYVEDKPVAAIMLFHYDEVLYYPYGGSDPKYREYMAPNLLHWEAIKLGKKLGCKIYDLWGSYKNSKDESDPWWGIYRFKSGFGGYEVNFPQAIDIPLSPLYPLYPLVDNFRWKILKILR